MTLPIPPNPPPLPPRPCMTPETLGVGDDIVAQALHALAAHPDPTPAEVETLLSGWARRDELTDEQRAEVLAYYQPYVGEAVEFDGKSWLVTR